MVLTMSHLRLINEKTQVFIYQYHVLSVLSVLSKYRMLKKYMEITHIEWKKTKKSVEQQK